MDNVNNEEALYKNWNELPYEKKFVASFSGGKDSTLALYMAMQSGQALGLISMFEENGLRSGAHGLKKSFVSAQAEAMGMKISFGDASWEQYEPVFTALLKDYRDKGAQVLVTGDLDMPITDCWHERVAENAGLELCSPLWGMAHEKEPLMFADAGFSSVVVCVDTEKGMKREDLGRIFCREYIDELISRGVDPSAEAGEFHTAVVDGPIFKEKLFYKCGDIRTLGKYFLLDIEL